MPNEIDSRDARQARKGFGVRQILIISMALVIVVMVGLVIFSG